MSSRAVPWITHNHTMSDFYTDQGAFFVRLFHSYDGLPEFVKNAEYGTELSVNSIPASSFADPDHRRLPLHTPADVYVSAAYRFGKTGAADDAIAARLEKAAALFGIEEDFLAVKELALAKYAGSHKKVAAPADYEGWTIETSRVNASGIGAKQLERLAGQLLSKMAGYSFDEREEIASELLLAARAVGADVPVELKKFAAEGSFDALAFSSALEQRASILTDRREKVAMLDEIRHVGETPAPSEDEMRKAACFLDTFDRQFSLDRHYGRGVIDPHSAVWSVVCEQHGPEMVKVGEVEHEMSKVAARLPEAFEYATGQIMNVLDNGKLDTGLLAGLSGKQSDVINQLLG